MLDIQRPSESQRSELNRRPRGPQIIYKEGLPQSHGRAPEAECHPAGPKAAQTGPGSGNNPVTRRFSAQRPPRQAVFLRLGRHRGLLLLALLIMAMGGGLRMTLEAALAMHKGATVTSKFTSPPLRPLRVTEVWVNARRTIVRFRVFALRGTRFDEAGPWLDSSGVELAPKDHEWSTLANRWEPRAVPA